jgi:hypothetical protein
MSKRKIDAEELVRRILGFDEDLLRDDYPQELVHAEIRDAGGDPEAIRAEGEAFVNKLVAERSEAESVKESRTRLRSSVKPTSSVPPAKETVSSMPPMRPNQSSETGPLEDSD